MVDRRQPDGTPDRRDGQDRRDRDRDLDVREAAADQAMRSADARMADAVQRGDEAVTAQQTADDQTAANIIDAAANSAEYRRALHDYTQLMRHRTANPLQAIYGMTQTLLDMPDLDAQTRVRMLRHIQQAANILLNVSLIPEIESDEERGMHPRPFE